MAVLALICCIWSRHPCIVSVTSGDISSTSRRASLFASVNRVRKSLLLMLCYWDLASRVGPHMTEEESMRRWTTGLLAFLVALSFSAPAFAQMEQGRLTGFVTDAQGAALPGVTVTATSPALLGANTAITEVDGRYLFPSLPSGRYQLKFELSGFQTDDSREHRARPGADAQPQHADADRDVAGNGHGNRRVSNRRRHDDSNWLRLQRRKARGHSVGHRFVGDARPGPRRHECSVSTPAAATRASRPDTRALAFATRTAS